MALEKIELSNISHSLDGVSILHTISFSAIKGRIHGILGPNGTGKTVTNKLLGLIYRADAGKIEWDGKIVNPWKSDQERTKIIRQIGLMWQNPVFINQSVKKNIEYPLKLRGIEREKRAKLVEEWLSKINLEEKADTNPKKLSIGQKQKVALARTLIYNPSLLILDEPTASLDLATKKWFEELILNEIVNESKIVIWNSHDFFQVKRIADDVSILINGSLIETGTKTQIFQKSKYPIVKRYLEGELI